MGQTWEEWEVPREADPDWPDAARPLHADWWEQRIARQREIDASIAAQAEFEYLYDRPYEDKGVARVAGPFTVESLSPHRVLGVDENDALIDGVADARARYGMGMDFADMILENLRTAGVQQAHKEDRIRFTALNGWPGDLIGAEGRYREHSELGMENGEGDDDAAFRERRAAILIGPEFGSVSRPDLVAAAREAADAGFDVLIACAFNYDAHASEFDKIGRIPVLKARMNADLHMAGDLKNTGKGNLFVIFGEPDLEVVSDRWLVTRDGRMAISYEQCKKLSGLGNLEEINESGRNNRSRFRSLSGRGEIRIEELSKADFPLSLTTDHFTQVTIRGVDVFHPQSGEIRSDGPDGIACWFIDTDYNEESFFVRQAYFLGANDPYKALQDHPQGGARRGRLGDPAQRRLAALSGPRIRADRRQGHQPPGRRGHEGAAGEIGIDAIEPDRVLSINSLYTSSLAFSWKQNIQEMGRGAPVNFEYVDNLDCAETHRPRKSLMMGFGAGKTALKTTT